MIEFFRFEQIKILGNELKYPENRNGVFRGYYGFKIAKLVKDPKTIVILEDRKLDTWQPELVRKDAKRFYRSENSRNWNNLYSENTELLRKLYSDLPKIEGSMDMGEYEPLTRETMLLLV